MIDEALFDAEEKMEKAVAVARDGGWESLIKITCI
jgi:hypothetical protein